MCEEDLNIRVCARVCNHMFYTDALLGAPCLHQMVCTLSEANGRISGLPVCASSHNSVDHVCGGLPISVDHESTTHPLFLRQACMCPRTHHPGHAPSSMLPIMRPGCHPSQARGIPSIAPHDSSLDPGTSMTT